ncbi:MAG TPA: potassium transporter TrkA [Planctomycetes bacterium]|nr:potassium transporter TrkA [Planctomycetota bacterium]
MTAVVSLLVVVVLAFVVTRVATVALVLTGMSPEMARFQARSAFTGCGFTTAEAEAVVNHPVRRRIILTLMQLGSAGVVGACATLFLSFVNVSDREALLVRSGVLSIGLLALLLIARSRWIERHLARVIARILRVVTDLEVRDYRGLLRLADGFAVSELRVEEGDWLAGRTLIELNLPAEGISVLGIHRDDGGYVAVPRGTSTVEAGDLLVLYGHGEAITDLDSRRRGKAGEEARAAAVAQEESRQQEQDAQEQERVG